MQISLTHELIVGDLGIRDNTLHKRTTIVSGRSFGKTVIETQLRKTVTELLVGFRKALIHKIADGSSVGVAVVMLPKGIRNQTLVGISLSHLVVTLEFRRSL